MNQGNTQVQDLMEVRYKVIGLWPNTDFTIGQIITNLGQSAIRFYDEYPHLFKKLEWWEERKPEEMPECIKNQNGRVYRVSKHFNDETKSACDIEDSDGYGRYYNAYLPATESEYLSYIKQSK